MRMIEEVYPDPRTSEEPHNQRETNMGCGSSRITVVEPVKTSNLNGNETDTLQFDVAQGGSRGDSAISKMTIDSGVSLDAAEAAGLPGTVPRLLPQLQAQTPGHSEERPESSEILEQLLAQGIIPAQPKHGESGQSYNIMMDDTGKARSRPPARLESLKTRKEQEITKKEDIEMKMRLVEERRKEREEDLKRRLRIKSARPRSSAPVNSEGKLDPEELLHSEQLPVPIRTKHGESEDHALTDSPELENDSTFQQNGDTDEGF
ncbi:stathmin domain-containing protein 1 [Danio rerio]|uniref:Stathmin domain-containing protein 1 n=1 Tax=Danio rerio TaxID=7955 RepID=A0A8M1RKX1_DANRE|nr:stathmin domain-containing protein 1 [Danio rerio]|eukprot:XP_002665640.3 stathmin domain-containing protein 1 [Danio rerio]